MTNFKDRVKNWLENQGRIQGSPSIKFENKRVIISGSDQEVRDDLLYLLTDVRGFYLSLPHNTAGMIIHPDGTIEAKSKGGFQEVPPGLYKILYVDLHSRSDSTQPVTEIALDGEQLTLRVLFRYTVKDPLAAIRIDRPIETLTEHLQSDLAQYIRTHNHNNIADRSNDRDAGQIYQFFVQRHATRHQLAKAILIEGIELKELTGDSEYVNMRRNTLTQQRQTDFERELLDKKNEIERLKVEQKLEIERINAQSTANTTALKNQILRETQKQDILLDNLRTQTQRRHELLVKAVDAVGQAVEHSSYSRNPGEIKNAINNLLEAIRENSPAIEQDIPKGGAPAAANAAPRTQASNKKIEDLTNTLLDLLKPKK